MDKSRTGLLKQSFSIPCRGGEIWCEHLDSRAIDLMP